MVIRPATSADLPAILDIYNEAVLHTTATYDYEPQTLANRSAWFEEHQRAGFPIFVAQEESGRVVGWSNLSSFHPRPGYRFTVQNSIYVAVDRRGRGVGKRLLAPLLEAARSRGFRAILAWIDADNEASLRLHAAHGFERVAHLREVGHKFGRWLDVVLMEWLHPERKP
jgi:phosphinothricin acetyltransferase